MDRIADSIAQIAAEAGATPNRPAQEWPLDLPNDILVALSRYRGDHPEAGVGAEMIRFIVRDRLMGMDYMYRREDPEGAN